MCRVPPLAALGGWAQECPPRDRKLVGAPRPETLGRIWVWVHRRPSANPNDESLLCGRLTARNERSDCSRRKLRAIPAHAMPSSERGPSAGATLTSHRRSAAGEPEVSSPAAAAPARAAGQAAAIPH